MVWLISICLSVKLFTTAIPNDIPFFINLIPDRLHSVQYLIDRFGSIMIVVIIEKIINTTNNVSNMFNFLHLFLLPVMYYSIDSGTILFPEFKHLAVIPLDHFGK